MNRILIVLAHPRYEHSRVNRALIRALTPLKSVSISDLYEEYADFNIDVEKEKDRLTSHDVIVWQFPLYLYAPPALLKQWFELVLEYGWAYGKGGNKLKGKAAFASVTTGGSRSSFSPNGHHRFALQEYLRPMEQTAYLCGLKYLPPFVVYGTYRLKEEELQKVASRYRVVLQRFQEGVPVEEIVNRPSLNDWISERGG